MNSDKSESENMGTAQSTSDVISEDPNMCKLYYPYKRLVSTLGLIDYELDNLNRPICLLHLNHNFHYLSFNLYLRLSENPGFSPVLDTTEKITHPYELFLELISIAIKLEYTTEYIIDLCCKKEPTLEEMGDYFNIEEGKIYLLDHQLMSSRDACQWEHPVLPVGSTIPCLSDTDVLGAISGYSDPKIWYKILRDLDSRKKDSKRYYDLDTRRFRNGFDKAVIYHAEHHILGSISSKTFNFCCCVLENSELYKKFQDWIYSLVPDAINVEPQLDAPPKRSVGRPRKNVTAKAEKKSKTDDKSGAPLDGNMISELDDTKKKANISTKRESLESKRYTVDTKQEGQMKLSSRGVIVKVNNKDGKKRQRTSTTVHKRMNIPDAIRSRVWRRHSDTFKSTCWVCGDEIDFNCWHCSHIISDANGGLPEADNLVPCCPKCNTSMKDKNMYDYMTLHHPKRISDLGWTPTEFPIVISPHTNILY